MQVSLKNYRDTYSFESIYGLKSIVLCHGNLLKMNEPIDILVISAFKNHYKPVSHTLIGHLYKNGIDVAKLSLNPELDLRKNHGVWLSRDFSQENNLGIKRIACVEFRKLRNKAINDDEIHKKIISLFAMFSAAQYSSIEMDTVAMPFLGTGNAKIDPEKIVATLIPECKRGLENLRSISQILLVDLNKRKVLRLGEALDKFVGRTSLQLADIALDDATKKLIERISRDLVYISDRRIKNNPALQKNLSVIYELLEVLRDIEKRKGFEFSVLCRRLLEVIMHDLATGLLENFSNGQSQLSNNIDQIAKKYKMAKWIQSYMHFIRILGNTSAHGHSNEIPSTPEIEDFRILLHCLAVVVPYWKQVITQIDKF